MEDETLASEMLSEIKATNKRLFVALIIVLALWFATIIGFFWYFSLPIEETSVEQAIEGEANTMVGIGDSYGEYTEGYEETQSSSSS